MDGMMTERILRYVLADTATHGVATIADDRLRAFTERHAYKLASSPHFTTGQNIESLATHADIDGVIFLLSQGAPGRALLRQCKRLLKAGASVYFLWPQEQAIEVIDDERLRSYWGLWLVSRVYGRLRRRSDAPETSEVSPAPPALAESRDLAARATPVAFDGLEQGPPTAAAPMRRVGMYARLDFWAPLTSGGSYGHTVYQAKALARTMEDFVCIVANPFQTLDELGIRQVVVQPKRRDGSEASIIDANLFYYERLLPLIAAVRPAFVFERLVLGNYAIAKICQELAIPYIAEYNGTEISMMRSFDGRGYEHEEFYLAAEEFSFKQATLVSVVSEHVGADVAKRGIPRERILVNPNAVDLNAYAPATPDEKRAIRAELGFDDTHRVIGFIGTFGGWHGVDVLAASLRPILGRAPQARFLLIGDGNLKPQVLAEIETHRLQDRVADVGRVPQAEGARLLKACDVLVSPHSSHMVDSKFFGSPTKLFEYMAMGAGIVASDLEQIGQVLRPALQVGDLDAGRAEVGDNRAVLCAPGNLDQFVNATLGLVNNPALSAALGQNARAAAIRYYTWDQHVADLWAVLSRTERRGFHADLAHKNI